MPAEHRRADFTTLSIPQLFLLLSLHQEQGRLLLDTQAGRYGLAGAILCDLVERELIDLVPEADGSAIVSPETHSSDTATTQQAEAGLTTVLTHALAQIRRRRQPETVHYWLTEIAPTGLRTLIAEPLIRRGLVGHQKRKILGIFPVPGPPAYREGTAAALQGWLAAELATPQPPGNVVRKRLATALALLWATGLADLVLGQRAAAGSQAQAGKTLKAWQNYIVGTELSADAHYCVQATVDACT